MVNKRQADSLSLDRCSFSPKPLAALSCLHSECCTKHLHETTRSSPLPPQKKTHKKQKQGMCRLAFFGAEVFKAFKGKPPVPFTATGLASSSGRALSSARGLGPHGGQQRLGHARHGAGVGGRRPGAAFCFRFRRKRRGPVGAKLNAWLTLEGEQKHSF